jgi:hypothetical protein
MLEFDHSLTDQAYTEALRQIMSPNTENREKIDE